MWLFLQNLLFTLVVPGTVAVYSRNPIYVGVVTVLLGWAALYRSPGLAAYAICVAAGFHAFVMLVEEPVLRRRFGAEYRDYCARVGRWLPRLRH